LTNCGKQTVNRKGKKQNIIKCATWNVRGIPNKEENLVSVLNEKQIKKAATAKAKKELKINCKQIITL
jgi:hypothetical protein